MCLSLAIRGSRAWPCTSRIERASQGGIVVRQERQSSPIRPRVGLSPSVYGQSYRWAGAVVNELIDFVENPQLATCGLGPPARVLLPSDSPRSRKKTDKSTCERRAVSRR